VLFFAILVLWVISLCLHEYAHARVAYAGGDHTVEQKGYLTLNPLRYIHPFMSIVLPLIILVIGGIPLPGGAVWIDHSRLRSRAWDAAVSAAGPLANVALFVLAALPFTFGLDANEPTSLIWQVLALFAFLQIFAAVINLIPIPGLDGFGIIAAYLSPEARAKAYSLGNLGFILLILILWVDNPVGEAIYRIPLTLSDGLGVPRGRIIEAFANFTGFLGR
jgi:Zn-dependent protease